MKLNITETKVIFILGFQSKHDTADFHGAARALGGCAVYVR